MWRALTIAAIALLVAALVPAVRHLRESPPPPPGAIRTSFSAEPGTELGAGQEGLDSAISDDGRQIVYVATRGGRVQLWHRAADATHAEALPGTEGAALPAWKFGGRAIAFFAEGTLKQVSLGDHMVRDLAPAPMPGGAAWLPDGSLLFSPDRRGPIKTMRSGVIADASHLVAGDRGHAFPSATPTGGFVYVATRTDGSRVARLVRDGQQSDLTALSGHAQLINDTLLYVRDGALLAQRFDDEARRLTGRAVVLAPAVGISASGHGFFAASARFVMTSPAVSIARQIWWFDSAGARAGPISEPGDYSQVRLSPDDRTLAVTALDPLLHTLDVFVIPAAAPRDAKRLSLSLGADSDPVWSPDSSTVAFHSAQGNASHLIERPARDGAETPLKGAPPGAFASDWRGRQLLVHAPSAATGLDIWLVDLAAERATPVTHGGFNERDGVWSPAGRQIAYVSDESGQPEIYVDAWPQGGGRVRVSFGGGERPQWARDGMTLFFMRGERVMRVSGFGRDTESAAAQPVFETEGLIDYAVAHRSERFAVLTRDRAERMDAQVITDWRGLMPVAPR